MVICIIAFYFAMVLGVSWLTTRRHDHDTDSFYRGDRKSPWWVVAIAMIGTSISGVTYVSVPGMVAEGEMSYLQMVMGFVAGYVAVAYILLPLYYRLNLSSIYVYLEKRYGTASHRTGAAFFLLSKYLGCAVRIYLTAVVLQLILFDGLGMPFPLSVACIMLIVWLYSFRGGVKTLVWTDLLQTLCLLSAMIGFVVCACGAMHLDIGGLCSTIGDSGMSRIWFFDNVNDKRFFWKQFLGGMFTTIAMTGLDQDMMQKNLSCRNLRDAQKNMVSYGIAFLPVNLIFLVLGILLYSYAQQLGMFDVDLSTLHDLQGKVIGPDQLFPYLATATNPLTLQPILPLIVGILFVLGLVASAFSSAGSAITALTTTLMVDFITVKAASVGRVRFRVHLLNSIVMGIMICVFHLLASGSVINAVYVVASYTYGPLLGLFFFGLLTKCHPLDRLVPAVCILSPVICWVLDSHSEQWFGGYHMGYELLIVNGLITAVGLWIISQRRATSNARREGAKHDTPPAAC